MRKNNKRTEGQAKIEQSDIELEKERSKQDTEDRYKY